MIKRFMNWRKRTWSGFKARAKQISNPAFWICDWSNDYDARKGRCLVFGKDLDTASKDANAFLYKFVKFPPHIGRDAFTVFAMIKKPNLFFRIITTAEDLKFRRVR